MECATEYRRLWTQQSDQLFQFLLGVDQVSEAVALAQERLARFPGDPRVSRGVAAELAEDAAYYQARPGCRTLVCCLFDPEGRLPDPRRLEAAWSRPHDDLDVRCIIP